MILVDTSVWVRHLRKGDTLLGALLQNEKVLCHPFVVGELSCGSLHNRREILKRLNALPQIPVVEHKDVLLLIENNRLWSRGLSWVDVHLLASAILTECALWTFDKALKDAAGAMHVSA